MNPVEMMIIAVLVVVITGIILALVFARRKRREQLQDPLGVEADHLAQALGDVKKAQTELDEREKQFDGMEVHPLSSIERERYLAEWAAAQAKFVEEQGQVVLYADRLILEVMQLRAYPVANFDQRAADLSVIYPALVTNYRAAREIAEKNINHQADTEELRRAMIYYQSLFEELLAPETVDSKEKTR